MNTIAPALLIAAIIFACGFAGALVYNWLPERLMQDNSRDLIKFVVSLTSTLSALVLGLLVASSCGLYNSQKAGLESLSARAVQLDWVLQQIGPEAVVGRSIIRNALIGNYERIRSAGGSAADELTVDKVAGNAQSSVAFLGALDPVTDGKKRLLSKAYDIAGTMGETSDLTNLQNASPVSPPLLIILTFWSSVLFFGCGRPSRINATVVAGLAVGALVLGCAIFLILELSQAYAGIIRAPTSALEAAIRIVGK